MQREVVMILGFIRPWTSAQDC